MAAGLGAGPAAADAAWWSWRDWEVGGRPAGAGAAPDLRQRYGSLDWPETPRVALTVRSDRSLPLRAVALEEFDGVAFHLGDGGSPRCGACRSTRAQSSWTTRRRPGRRSCART